VTDSEEAGNGSDTRGGSGREWIREAGLDWLTYREAAMLLLCEPKTIQNRVAKHGLPRKLVKQGRAHRRVALIAPATVIRLGVLMGRVQAGGVPRWSIPRMRIPGWI